MWDFKILSLLFLLAGSVLASPVAEQTTGNENEHGTKLDLPVEQLEKLKTNESIHLGHLADTTGAREQINYHSLDTVKANGELVSQVEQHASAEKAPGETPKVHSHVRVDVPGEGIHKEIVQDGDRIVETDAASTTAISSDEQTTKVFHGAARLIQAGSGTNVPQNTHTAVRRAFNADLTKEIKNNVDHYSAYTGVQYSPLDMAEYVFWTGDERSVTTAIENFLQEGLMTKEEAITFLQEIKFNIESLRAHYAQTQKSAEEVAQQEKLKSMLMEQVKEGYGYHPANLQSYQSFPFGNSPDIIRSIASKNFEMSNHLTPALGGLPALGDFQPEPSKKAYSDPMLQTNLIGAPEYEKDIPLMTEEEYEEVMDKLKLADSIIAEFQLDEAVRQITKMLQLMFAQTLSPDPHESRSSSVKLLEFLAVEAETGQLSKALGRKVLDSIFAGLTADSVGEHSELLQPHDRTLHHSLDQNTESRITRALLSAYKDEIFKNSVLHKNPYNERN